MAGFSPDTPRGLTGTPDGRYGDTALHLAAQSGSLQVHLAPCALSHLNLDQVVECAYGTETVPNSQGARTPINHT